ncbi:MAG: serine/threonine-protein kinase [Polyangiaceae bacterium]
MVALTDPQELVGAVLNRTWKLVRVIGQGGLGIVYEAHHQSSTGAWAVKLLQHEFVEEETTVARFLAEAEAAKRMNHPGIVRVFEAQRAEDGTPYLVMELLSGQSLQSLMTGPMAPRRAVQICSQLLEALDAVHRVGVIHRDVKPDNVFVLNSPDGEHVKLLDLGLARVMDAAGGMSRKTKTGMMLGTPGYMSPEQIKNVKESDLRSDLWAVGVILYELLSGRQAFGAPTEFARMTAALTEPIVPLGTRAPELAVWDGFFERALAKEPIERFQSATEMLAALRAVPLAPTSVVPAASVVPNTAASPPTLAGMLPEAAPSLVSPAPPGVPRTNTRVSADNPVHSGHQDRHFPPPVEVVEQQRGPRISLWAALLLAGACLCLGVLLGMLLAR